MMQCRTERIKEGAGGEKMRVKQGRGKIQKEESVRGRIFKPYKEKGGTRITHLNRGRGGNGEELDED